MPDVGTTLLAIREVDRPNLGVTLDFAHVLFADEMPAYVGGPGRDATPDCSASISTTATASATTG